MARKSSVKAAAIAKTEAPAPVITSIKGFGGDLVCSGPGYRFQYAIGQTFTHDGPVKACNSGFHAYPVEEHPLTVFDSYAPAGNRFFEVEQSGETSRKNAKLASAVITVKFELSISDLVKRAFDYVWSRCTVEPGASATGYQGAASATGYQGAASATGDQGAASATGDQGAASATGRWCGAYATGLRGRVSGNEGSPLHLDERLEHWGHDDHGKVIAVWAGIVGQNGIKPGVFYILKDGQPVEAE